MHALKDKVSQKLSNLFADSATSPRYSLTDSPKATLNSTSESCPPIHGNRKNQAATVISSGQDKDTKLRVSAQVESDYNEGVKEIEELTESSAFISANLFEFLHACLPNIVRGCKWILLYSTLKHGISLRTLLRRSADLPGPCLLVAGDKQGAVFGAMLECPLRTTPKRKYQAG